MSPPPHVPGWSLIHHATANGDPVALRTVIASYPADLDAPDTIGRQPLHLALAMGPAGMMVAGVLLETAPLPALAPVAVQAQRDRILRFARGHGHRRARLAAVLWSAELGRGVGRLVKPTAADHAWATGLAALVGPEANLRVCAMLAAIAP